MFLSDIAAVLPFQHLPGLTSLDLMDLDGKNPWLSCRFSLQSIDQVPALDAMSLSTTSFDVAFAAANVGLAYVIALPLNEASCGAWCARNMLDRDTLRNMDMACNHTMMQ